MIIILSSILRFSQTNLTISVSFSFAAERRLDFNRERMKFQLLSLVSFVLGSAGVHEDKVSSLNKFEEVFAQRHSFMKATLRETEN